MTLPQIITDTKLLSWTAAYKARTLLAYFQINCRKIYILAQSTGRSYIGSVIVKRKPA
jgi:hypothetical protein